MGFVEIVSKYVDESSPKVYVGGLKKDLGDIEVITTTVKILPRKRGEWRSEHWWRNLERLVQSLPFDSVDEAFSMILDHPKNDKGNYIKLRWVLWKGDVFLHQRSLTLLRVPLTLVNKPAATCSEI